MRLQLLVGLGRSVAPGAELVLLDPNRFVKHKLLGGGQTFRALLRAQSFQFFVQYFRPTGFPTNRQNLFQHGDARLQFGAGQTTGQPQFAITQRAEKQSGLFFRIAFQNAGENFDGGTIIFRAFGVVKDQCFVQLHQVIVGLVRIRTDAVSAEGKQDNPSGDQAESIHETVPNEHTASLHWLHE